MKTETKQTVNVPLAKKQLKTMYHSDMAKLGPVQVTVDSEPQVGRVGGDPSAKPYEFVLLTLAVRGKPKEQVAHTFENPACRDFFVGKAGKTFTLVAQGVKAEASFVYVGEPGTSLPDPKPKESDPDQAVALEAAAKETEIAISKPEGPAAPIGKDPMVKDQAEAGIYRPLPAAPAKCVQVRIDITIGLPGYSSIKVGLTMETGDEKSTAVLDKAKAVLNSWVDRNYPGQRKF